VGIVDRFAFKRLLGPLEDVLKRNEDKYAKYAENMKSQAEIQG